MANGHILPSETMPVCAVCGGTEMDNDATRGDSVCVKCGNVMEDNMIIAEVSYTDASTGGGVMIGQFVNADGMYVCLRVCMCVLMYGVVCDRDRQCSALSHLPLLMMPV
jgi:hypothetical protein